MSEEPQLPPIPAIGDILDRKDRFIERVYTVVKCNDCEAKFTRRFKVGDYTFKKVDDEECKECKKSSNLIISEVYSKWIDPRKEK